jgi:hypothetical protein
MMESPPREMRGRLASWGWEGVRGLGDDFGRSQSDPMDQMVRCDEDY